MSGSAITMLLIGAIGLWGGCAVVIINYVRASRAEKANGNGDEAASEA